MVVPSVPPSAPVADKLDSAVSDNKPLGNHPVQATAIAGRWCDLPASYSPATGESSESFVPKRRGRARRAAMGWIPAFRTRKEIWQSARPQASANTLQAPGLPEQKELQPEALKLRRAFPPSPASFLSFQVLQADVAEALRPRSSTLQARAVLEALTGVDTVSGRLLWKEPSAAAREASAEEEEQATSEPTAQGLSNAVQGSATVRWHSDARFNKMPRTAALAVAFPTGHSQYEALVTIRREVARFQAQERGAWRGGLGLQGTGEALPEFLGQEAAGRPPDVQSRSMLLEAALASAGSLRAPTSQGDGGPLQFQRRSAGGAGAVLTLLENGGE
ncbi:hypothetical protein AK812_SmicGene28378 [Symbiodinium microadriaticum]|uniref:Uncharacterized protein n=1 Tax=Symbiodinium microadriaticum TaxID=2951 RepID=A0A1Q9D4G0_SYMMI|nr:hypothetical protein AK812_SmicGene28378 [Symbiodinium microadriaticum]